MKIAIRGGHNFQAVGASALIDEVVEDRKIKDSVLKYLKQLGHEVLDVTPDNMNSDNDLVYGVSKANSFNVDLFVSIHFNKAYNSYNGKIGTEAWVYSKSDNIKLDEEIAQRIVNNVSALGFKDRGVKERKDLYELKNTKMASIIVEVCFVEATEDVALYKKLGPDAIGKVIAEAIANKKAVTVTPNPTPAPSTELYRVRKSWADAASQKGAYSSLDSAKKECNKYSGYSVFNSKGEKVYPVVASKQYLNLKPHMKTWAVYNQNGPYSKAYKVGDLAPAQYGGISYEILGTKAPDIYLIKTGTFGLVAIWAPKDNDSSITSYSIY